MKIRPRQSSTAQAILEAGVSAAVIAAFVGCTELAREKPGINSEAVKQLRMQPSPTPDQQAERTIRVELGDERWAQVRGDSSAIAAALDEAARPNFPLEWTWSALTRR